MKRLFLFITIVFLGFTSFAEGFAIGGDVFGQWPIGDYSKIANANFGLSVTGEYTFPLSLPLNMDLGAGIRAEYGHVFPKADANLKSDEEIRAFANIWLRIPFKLFNQNFAFQPEAGGGISTFFTKYQNKGTEKNAAYLSPLINLAASLRWMPASLQNLEIELAPVLTIIPEKDSSTNMLGLRLGAIWHFKKKNSLITEDEEISEPESEVEQEPALEPIFEEASAPEPESEEKNEESPEPEPELEPEPEPELEPEPEPELEPELEPEPEPELEPQLEPEPEFEAPSESQIEPEPQIEEQSESEEVPEKTRQPKIITERLVLKRILYFSKNGAVFTGLSRKQIAQNEQTIDEAVELIKQHPECTVLIEGYAHNISGTEKEDRRACMPLSLWRAEYIKKELIKRGINADKIETVGKGSANSMADKADRSSWWKDRRVEFLITYESEVENE